MDDWRGAAAKILIAAAITAAMAWIALGLALHHVLEPLILVLTWLAVVVQP